MQALLLLLQEQYGLRVNLILLACWVGSEGKCFTPASLLRVHEQTQHWHETTVKALRAMRRSIDISEETLALRESLKKSEINAEQVELFRLYETCHEYFFDTTLDSDKERATLNNLLLIFEMPPATFHLDLLIQLSCIALDSLSESRAAEIIRSLKAT